LHRLRGSFGWRLPPIRSPRRRWRAVSAALHNCGRWQQTLIKPPTVVFCTPGGEACALLLERRSDYKGMAWLTLKIHEAEYQERQPESQRAIAGPTRKAGEQFGTCRKNR
jgi:hypothetical protein